MDLSLLGGFIEQILPWLFGILCALVLTLDVLSVFSKAKRCAVGILNAVCHLFLILGLFFLGAEIHLMVLVFFSSILLICVLEYLKFLFIQKRDGGEGEI